MTDETHHGIRIHENLMNETPVDGIPTGGTLMRATLIDESTENGRADTPGTLESAALESATLETATLESATLETGVLLTDPMDSSMDRTLESATLETDLMDRTVSSMDRTNDSTAGVAAMSLTHCSRVPTRPATASDKKQVRLSHKIWFYSDFPQNATPQFRHTYQYHDHHRVYPQVRFALLAETILPDSQSSGMAEARAIYRSSLPPLYRSSLPPLYRSSLPPFKAVAGAKATSKHASSSASSKVPRAGGGAARGGRGAARGGRVAASPGRHSRSSRSRCNEASLPRGGGGSHPPLPRRHPDGTAPARQFRPPRPAAALLPGGGLSRGPALSPGGSLSRGALSRGGLSRGGLSRASVPTRQPPTARKRLQPPTGVASWVLRCS